MKMQKMFLPVLTAIALFSLVGCQENENDPIKDNDPIHELAVTRQDCKDIHAKPRMHRGEKIINRKRIEIIATKCLLGEASKRSTYRRQ